MEFRLTYSGPLRASQRDPLPGQRSKHVPNKREIRRAFHEQLKKFWQITPSLKQGGPTGTHKLLLESSPSPTVRSIEELAKRHTLHGYNFVPLVTEQLNLICGLDVLFLRPDRPGNVWAGDIDNRLKTLFDAMRIPEAGEDYANTPPAVDENPFFCLLEDDKLITKIEVETDRLLQEVSGDAADVRLVMTVRIRPYDFNDFNMHLG